MLSVLQCTEQPLTPQPKVPGASPGEPTGKHFHTTSNSPFPSSQLSDNCHASLLLRRQPEQPRICGADTRLGQCSGTSQTESNAASSSAAEAGPSLPTSGLFLQGDAAGPPHHLDFFKIRTY